MFSTEVISDIEPNESASNIAGPRSSNVPTQSWTGAYVRDSDDFRFLLCNLCVMKGRGSPKWSAKRRGGLTSNIGVHLFDHHGIKGPDGDNTTSVLSGPLDRHVMKETRSPTMTLVRAATLWIVTDHRPLSIGNSAAFRRMLSIYKDSPRTTSFPSASAVSRELHVLYNQGVSC